MPIALPLSSVTTSSISVRVLSVILPWPTWRIIAW